jgi:hypothetical protein
VRLRNLLLGVALTRLLDRLGGSGEEAAAAPVSGRAHEPVAEHHASRPLVAVMLTTFAVGAVLMLLFDTTLTRIAGMLALVTFVVSGVFLIADPQFLGPDDEAA